jgi:hypothetical protein
MKRCSCRDLELTGINPLIYIKKFLLRISEIFINYCSIRLFSTITER